MNEKKPAVHDESASGEPGLPMASLLMGILAIIFSFIIVGAILAVIGIMLGTVDLLRKVEPRYMAKRGTILSIFGLVLSLSIHAVSQNIRARKAEEAYRQAMASDSANGSGGGGETTAPQEQSGPSAAGDTGKKASEQPRQKYTGPRTSQVRSKPGINPKKLEKTQGPDIRTGTFQGSTNQMTGLDGKRVVLFLWAPWSLPCARTVPHLVKLVDEYQSNDVSVVGITTEPVSALESFTAKNRVNFTLVSSTNLPPPLDDVNDIPTMFFIDTSNVVQHVLVGYREYDEIKAKLLGPEFAGTNAPAIPAN